MSNRTRISTTVDAARLERARQAFDLPDSQLVDRALEALLDLVDGHLEREALRAQPYDTDPNLAWLAPAADPLPYDGAIPEQVLRLAAERRASYGER